ncbi:MAG: hypothetical protein RQ745_00840 [Longimicrobiales bacterium]|nr:hypothetical protein [Longimicrobiales bacterium]
MKPHLLMVERAPDAAWGVVTSTRPIASLRVGVCTVTERIERWSGSVCAGVLARGALEGFEEEGSGRTVIAPADAGAEGTLFWNSRAIPLLNTPPPPLGPRPGVIEVAGRYAGLWLPPGRRLPIAPGDLPDGRTSADAPAIRADDGEVPVAALEGVWLDAPWSLIEHNPALLAADLDAFHGLGPDGTPTHHRYEGHPSAWIERGHPVWTHEDVDIGPGVILDAREGAIRLDQGVRVSGPARLSGPLHLGWDTWVLGGSVARSSIGPVSKVHGEIADSILLGWANKAHDGHLGHALVGRWVNLGAGTTNSDLRNDYATVKVELPDRRVDSGLVKLGCMIGDHVKTGIGTLIPSGATLGAGSQIATGGLVAARIPPFSWVTSRGIDAYRLDRFEDAMRAVMARRYQLPSPGVIRILRRLHAEVHGAGGERETP